MIAYNNAVLSIMQAMAVLFIFVIGVGVLFVLWMYIAYISKSAQAIHRNYPVVGLFLYLFEHLGDFFRLYFFRSGSRRMPFNRAQRSCFYRSARDLNTVALGSTHSLKGTGTIIFINYPFPPLYADAVKPEPFTIAEQCEKSYTTLALYNTSGMSYV